MADCADVDMGFVALEDLFGHICTNYLRFIFKPEKRISAFV
jgi:hypothetical protein